MSTVIQQHREREASFELPALTNFIAGGTSTPQVERGNAVCDPNTRAPLQDQLSCSEAQVEEALAAAQQAFEAGHWEQTEPVLRAEMLEAIADALEKPDVQESMAVADAITTGAVIRVTRLMARLAPHVFRAAAGYLRERGGIQFLPGKLSDVEYFRSPWGPALLVSPWNGPTTIGSHKVASALAAGAPCILKPSEWAPHSAIIMAEIIDQLGLPEGVFQLTCGSRLVGGQMVRDPRIQAISFTGGLTGGRDIANACADSFKPLQLELGGNNPLVVMSDADLDKAAEGIVYGLSNLNAQWCRALGRVIVHNSVKQPLLYKVEEKLAQLTLGSSLEDDSDMGPMIHQAHYESIQRELERLRDCGGSAINPTPMPSLPGFFIAPTLVDGCTPEQTMEEIFGPVATIHGFDTDAEALALANGTPYGLAAYVYSENEEAAFRFGRRIRTGSVKINGYSLLSLSGAVPRGAWGLSGLGEEGTAESIEFFTGARVVGVSPQDEIGRL